MMSIIRATLMGIICWSPACFADVSITINQQSFEYDYTPRLNEVLASVAYEQNWYWPASKLYQLDSTRTLTLRNDVVAKLKFMALSLDGQFAQRVQALIQQIRSWQLADRVLVNIDYDKAQLDPLSNPQFDNGQYQLNLVTRPDNVGVFGLAEDTPSISLSPKTCAHEYVNATFSSLENKDFVYIIAADGQISKVGIAYWNASCVDIMPGSQVFLPFPESQFFSDNTELNNQIIKLALNRIM